MGDMPRVIRGPGHGPCPPDERIIASRKATVHLSVVCPCAFNLPQNHSLFRSYMKELELVDGPWVRTMKRIERAAFPD